MKKSIVKMILPIAVFVLAITAAFASHGDNAVQKAALAPEQGWLNVDGVCNESIQCSDTGTQLCTTITNQQVFGKDEAGDCTVELYRTSN